MKKAGYQCRKKEGLITQKTGMSGGMGRGEICEIELKKEKQLKCQLGNVIMVCEKKSVTGNIKGGIPWRGWRRKRM